MSVDHEALRREITAKLAETVHLRPPPTAPANGVSPPAAIAAVREALRDARYQAHCDGVVIVTLCPVCATLPPGLRIELGGKHLRAACVNGCTERAVLGKLADINIPGAAQAALAAPLAVAGEGKLRRLDVLKMMNTLPPEVPWIAEPLLVRGALTLLVGREGEGKSMVALTLAIGVASGEAVAGFHPTAGKVLYVDAENSPGEIHRRVRALGLDTTAAKNLVVVEAEAFDLRHDLSELDQLLATERPSFVVLDSFRALWGGSENDSDVVGPVLDKLRNLGRRHDASTLLLHHSGKVGSEYRGSTAIGASAELIFTLAREPDDDDPQRRYLACRKSRPAPEPGRRWLRLSTELGMTFVEECDPPDGHAVQPKPTQPARAELAPRVLDLIKAGEMSRPDIARALGRTPKDGTVRRVIEALVQAGEIEVFDGLYKGVPGASSLKGSGTVAPHSEANVERWKRIASDDEAEPR